MNIENEIKKVEERKFKVETILNATNSFIVCFASKEASVEEKREKTFRLSRCQLNKEELQQKVKIEFDWDILDGSEGLGGGHEWKLSFQLSGQTCFCHYTNDNNLYSQVIKPLLNN